LNRFDIPGIVQPQVRKSILLEVNPVQNPEKTDRERESAGDMPRAWRRLKRISRMDLALDAGISPKHESFFPADEETRHLFPLDFEANERKA
jgi:hypothetical protein